MTRRRPLPSLCLLLSLLLSLAGGAMPARAQQFSAPIDASAWNLTPSIIECKLWQAVPQFGEAGFSMRAGGKLQFYLKPNQGFHTPGKAHLSIVAPPWHDGVRPRALGEAEVLPETRSLVVGEAIAEQFVAELQLGMFPSVKLPGAFAGDETRVDVSAVNFRSAYEGFQSCFAGLFPYSYHQLQSTTLEYEPTQVPVPAPALERLDLLAKFMSLDPSIKQVVLDGYGDGNAPTQEAGENLARMRANAVREYLIGKGINGDIIVVRYHADPEPVRQYRGARERYLKRTGKLPAAGAAPPMRKVIVQLLKG